MRSFDQIFTIHPVGQGLFYSCIIKTAINKIEADFKLVFDCGSLTHNSSDEEVEEFRDNYLPDENSRIGLLVISHFDADHVNKIVRLLRNGNKVDKLVIPFTLIQERLFIVLRYLVSKGRGFDSNDIYTLSLIIDPVGTLGDNFDDDTTIFLITPGPVTPFDGGESKISEEAAFNISSPNLEFDFDNPKNDLTKNEKKAFLLVTPAKAKLNKVKDTEKGHIHFKTPEYVRLMEFLFYRRSIGDKENKFYKAVFKSFCAKYKIKMNKDSKVILKEIIDAVKTIRGGTIVKELFKQAKLKVPSVKIVGRDLLNMNTTALCMLHVNLPSILAIFCSRIHDSWYRCHYRSFRIQKFDGTNNTRTLDYIFADDHYPFYRMHRLFENFEDFNSKFIYPNCLLTSDSYLAENIEIELFYNKYCNYWNNFWLFQIPHHGSKNNSNQLLF